MKALIEEIAYDSIKKSSPDLIKTITAWLAHGLTPEQIIDLCVEKTNIPRHRLAFIGCAADHIIRHTATTTETIQ